MSVTVTCQNCGAIGLSWFSYEGDWVLFESDKKPHVCKGAPSPAVPVPPDGVIPARAELDKLTTKQLRELATAMNLGPNGEREAGDPNGARWRVTARRSGLEAAFESARGGGAPPAPLPPPPPSGKGHDCNWPEIDKRIAHNGKIIEHTVTQKCQVVLKAAVTTLDSKYEALSTKLMAEVAARSPIRVVDVAGNIKEIGRQHERFGVLLDLMARGLHVFLVGPAGSGKTTAIIAAAQALNKKYFVSSMSSQTPESRMYGYNDAQGRYVPGVLFAPYVEGYVLGLDELDNSNPNVLAALNSALSNTTLGFPHGMFERGEGFVCVGAGNTYGMGANRVYVGRQQIDGATLDRFTVLNWPYDEMFEMDLALAWLPKMDDGAIHPQEKPIREWVARVQGYRHNCDKLGLRHIISPRASIHGARLLATESSLPLTHDNHDMPSLESTLVWRGLDMDTVNKIKKGATK